jgi:hypothetical protein
MPIFARRTLQRLLDRVAPFSSLGKLQDQIQRLNKGGQDGIATAWELAVTAGLSDVGDLAIEPELGTPTRVDFTVRLQDPAWYGIGDIVTVFDEGMHKESGLQAREVIVWERVRAHRLSRKHFNLWLEGDVAGSGRRQRIKLPPLQTKLLGTDLNRILLSIKKAPDSPRTADLRRHHGFHLRYDPKQHSGTWSGTRIDTVYGIDANPMMNALKRKANQLRNTVFEGPRIIICCDGGSEAIRANRNPVWRAPSNEDIVNDFLRQNPSIAGVILVIVNASPLRAVISARDRELYLIPNAAGPRASQDDRNALDRFAAHLELSLPRVILSPGSLLQPWTYKPDYGFFRFRDSNFMSSNHIQIPMRALQELLAGTLDHKAFLDQYVLTPTGDMKQANLFAAWLSRGCLINDARIIPDPDRDDDWVELKFGEPDPALVPFRNPKAPLEGTQTLNGGETPP